MTATQTGITATVAWLLAFAALTQCAPDPVAAQVDAADIIHSTRAERPERLTMPSISPEAHRATPAVILATVGWSEAGAYVTPGELAALHEVLVTGMTERSTYQRRAWAYSHGLRHPRHAWLLRLGRRTPGTGMPAYVREHWPRTLAAADAVLAGTVTHACDARPLGHWGGPEVDAVAIRSLGRRGWRTAVCPGYENAFMTRGGAL